MKLKEKEADRPVAAWTHFISGLQMEGWWEEQLDPHRDRHINGLRQNGFHPS